jgi:hypothetical protein
MARERIPGIPADAEIAINDLVKKQQDRLDLLEKGPTSPAVITKDFTAREGQFLRVQAPATGLSILLPKANPSNRNARVTFSFESVHPVTIRCIGGVVNRESQVINTTLGTFEATCDGQNGWSVGFGLSASGSPTGAQYVLGAAHGSLPNASVATDSTEIDVTVTPGATASWALRVASILLAKLQDLTGLSVLGRAANSAGVMAAITATAGRQVLRANDAGTALAWGNPIDVQDDNVLQGAVHTLDFTSTTSIAATATVGSGEAVVSFTRAALTGAVTASAGSNTTAFGAANARTVLSNATNASAVPTFVQANTARHVYRDNSTNTGLEWGYPIGVSREEEFGPGTAVEGYQINLVNSETVNWETPTVSSGIISIEAFRQAISGAVEIPLGSNSSVFSSGASGAGLTGGGTAVLNVGAGNHITVNANDVAVSDMAQASVIGRAFGSGTGAPQDLSGNQLGQILRFFTGVDDSPAVGVYNNYALAAGPLWRISTVGAGDIDLTGLAFAPGNTAAFLYIIRSRNSGTSRLILRHENAGSTAGNRFLCPDGKDIVVDTNYQIIFLQYVGSRWYVHTLPYTNVRKNSTGTVFSQRRLNLIEGSNVTLTVADDTTDNEIDVTVAASGTTINGMTVKWGGGVSTYSNIHTIDFVNGDGIPPPVITESPTGELNLEFNVDVSDFAGTGLEDDGLENLRIAASAAGNGLTGGAGSALAVGAGDGITVNANDVAVNATAIAGSGLENDGSNNLRTIGALPLDHRYIAMVEEFLSCSEAASIGATPVPIWCDTGWWFSASGGATSAIAYTAGLDQHPGIATMTTPATANIGCFLTKGEGATAPIMSGTTDLMFDAIVRFGTSTDVGFRIGLSSTFDSAAGQHFYFESDTTVSAGAIHCYYASGVGRTSAGSTAAPSTNWVRLSATRVSSTLTWYVNGTQIATFGGVGVPAGAMNFGAFVYARSANARTLLVDRLGLFMGAFGSRV